jgi:DNA (cytosine-5)-methyltransferase 1
MNKGERSEFFALLTLVNDNKLHFASSEFTRSDEYVLVTKVSENDSSTYIDLSNKDHFSIIDKKTNKKNTYIKNQIIDNNFLKSFFDSICNNKEFNLEHIQNILSITKSKGRSNEKSDIQISFNEYGSEFNQLHGINIKSKIGANPTLLNACKEYTNIIYEVLGFEGDLDSVNRINGSSKIINRVKQILADSSEIIFHGYEKETFRNNLKMIDSHMPELLAKLVLDRYVKEESFIRNLFLDKFEQVHITRLLNAVSFGMFPTKEWNGVNNAFGIISIQQSGQLLFFHIVKQEVLNDYLFNHTYIETPSSTRHDFGYLYVMNGKLFFKLNAQLRIK